MDPVNWSTLQLTRSNNNLYGESIVLVSIHTSGYGVNPAREGGNQRAKKRRTGGASILSGAPKHLTRYSSDAKVSQKTLQKLHAHSNLVNNRYLKIWLQIILLRRPAMKHYLKKRLSGSAHLGQRSLEKGIIKEGSIWTMIDLAFRSWVLIILQRSMAGSYQ